MTSTERKEFESINVEAVRLPVEVELRNEISRYMEFQRIKSSVPPFDFAKARRISLATALRLSEDMAPKVHEATREAMKILGIKRPFEIFQHPDGGMGSTAAIIYSDKDPILIQLVGRITMDFDHGSLLAALGHELGHFLAHSYEGQNPLAYPPEIIKEILFFSPNEQLRNLVKSYSMACELTCDRFGLLTCQDLDAMLRLEMFQASGITSPSMNTNSYLEQCKALMEQSLESGEVAQGTTHPEHNLRVYAEWLFYETVAFNKITGKGPGIRKLAEVNQILSKLLVHKNEPPKSKRGFGAKKQPKYAPGIKRPGQVGFAGKAGSPNTAGFSSPDESSDVMKDVKDKLKTASGAIQPGISKIKQATAAGMAKVVGRKYYSSSPEEPEETVDDFELDEEKELLKRFADLEKRMKDS